MHTYKKSIDICIIQFKEFKKFLLRGNAIDLAIGVVVGGRNNLLFYGETDEHVGC